MTTPEDRDAVGVALAFLQAYSEDRGRGAPQTLAEYQARFAGFEEVIAREFERLQLEPVGAEDGASPDLEDEPSSRYEYRGEVGRGGMGEVHRVWDRQLRRLLAMKITRPARGSDGTVRLLEEAQITAQLSHPAIVPVHEVGVRSDGRAFFTMALVEGQNFKDVIDAARAGDSTWTVERALEALLRVCEAVAFAHSKKVIHRDLKPANVMVGRFGETFVMDWGLARVVDRPEQRDIRIAPLEAASRDEVRSTRSDLVESDPDSPLVTMDGDVIGTPAYMAPEQARGELDRVGPQVDVYAIGAMLYHLLGGQVPYADVTQSAPRSILARVLAGPPEPLQLFRPGLPPELVAICERAMAQRPEQRYSDVGELAADLRAYLEIRVVQAYRGGSFARLRKWVRRNRALTLAVGGIVLALVVGLVASMSYHRQAESRLGLALTAIDRMLERVGTDTLEDIPEAQPTRRALLEDALGLLETLLRDRPADSLLRERVAITGGVLGHLVWRLGDPEAGAVAARRAIELLTVLAAEQPGSHRLRQELGRNRSWLAAALKDLGELEVAEAVLLESSAALSQWRSEFPRVVGFTYLMADCEQKMASLLHSRGRVQDALPHQLRAVELGEAILDKRSDRKFLEFVANAQNFLATCYLSTKEYELQKACGVTALGLIDRVLAAGVTAHARQLRAGILTNLAIVTKRLDGAAVAVPVAREAVAAFRGLAADYPSIPGYQSRLGANLNNLCGYLYADGDHVGSLRAGAEAVFHQRRATRRAERPEYWERLRKNLESCLHAVSVASERAIAEMAEELLALSERRLVREWDPGVVLAILARHASKAAPEEAARCRGHAVSALRAAAAAGFADSDVLLDSHYDPLRQDPEFAGVVAELTDRDEFGFREAEDDPRPVESTWVTEFSREQLQSLVDGGWRIVDLGVDDPDPLRLTAVLVRNTGRMQCNWRWQCDQPLSSPDLVEFARGGHAIDLEVWSHEGKRRSAVVVVESEGRRAVPWRWQTAKAEDHPGGRYRYTDQIVRGRGKNRRVTYLAIVNTLWSTRDWRAGYDLTQAELEELTAEGWKCVEVDRSSDLQHVHCLFVRDAVADRRWFLGKTKAQVDDLLVEHGARLTKVQSFVRGGARYYDGVFLVGGAK